MRILFVEDEESIRETLKLNLELEGYEVVATDDGRKALDLIAGQHFDLMLFDVMLPNVDGFTLTEQVRLTNQDVPIIMLTAKDLTADKVLGFKKGIDDYITKPFSLEELLLRIQSLLKRSARAKGDTVETYAFGGNTVNFTTYLAVNWQNEHIELTNKEALLLKLLIERNNEVVSRNQILQFVWGYDVFPSTRTIDNFILTFRKVFERDQKNPEFFHSIRGVGYKFTN